MNVIEIKIGNKNYKISCRDGEENHIISLSKKLNERFKNLSARFSHKADDSLLLVIIGIVLEDELQNLKNDKVTDNKSRSVIEKTISRIDEVINKLETAS